MASACSAESRFWAKVSKVGPYHKKLRSRCWIWFGRVSKEYGQFQVSGRNLNVHRFSWIIHFGNTKLQVCHKCDNPLCVNPKHLFVGTQQDNMTDMVVKDRSLRGERNYFARLTPEQVLEIRNRFVTNGSNFSNRKELATEFGVASCTITQIAYGKLWKHLPVSH